MELNNSQKFAADHFCGPLLCIAGPGSGKTTVIMNRIGNLITKYKVKPDHILAITFTKAAAVDMEKRFVKLYGGSHNITIGTIHSIFFAILQQYDGYEKGDIISVKEQKLLLRRAYNKSVNVQNNYVPNDILDILLREMSVCKQSRNFISSYFPAEVFAQIYNNYIGLCSSNRKLDFDDILIKAKELLTNNCQILSNIRQRYRFIMVDEYQDINELQHDLISLIAAPDNNIFAVGDDDQSIYGFRGSTPQFMLDFNKQYKDGEICRLEMNYRCDTRIVQVASKLIRNNRMRYDKQLVSYRGNDKDAVIIKGFMKGSEQTDYIINRISELLKKDKSKKIAVLYRNSNSAVGISCGLRDSQIGFYMKDRGQGIYKNNTIKKLLSYIKINFEQIAIEDVDTVWKCSYPAISRHILAGQNMIDRHKLRQRLVLYMNDNIPKEEQADIQRFLKDWDFLEKLNTYGRLNYARFAMGFNKIIDRVKKYEAMSNEGGIIDDLLCTVYAHGMKYKAVEWYIDFINEYREESFCTDSTVTLSTIHSAKGLEYDIVFIIDVNEEVIPHGKKLETDVVEEERRLFYVALTRAKEKVFVLYTRERFGKQMRPSRFIQEMM